MKKVTLISVVAIASVILIIISLFGYKYFINQASETVYKINFSRDNGFKNNPDIFMRDYITSILEINQPENGLPIFYDINGNNPHTGWNGSQTENLNRFNAEYYIILDKTIDTAKFYKKDGLILNIQKTGQNLLPFLKNWRYCENDNDCTVRTRDCAQGSFNKFNFYYDIFGCESPMYSQESWDELNKLCDSAKEHPGVNYGGSKCINNKCTGIDRKVICIPGVLP